MKILQINNYHYIKGGADRVYLNTSELLKANNQTVLNFSSLNPLNSVSEYADYFVPLNDNRKMNFAGKLSGIRSYLYNDLAAKKLESLLQKYRPDLAHLHLYYGGLSASVLKTLKHFNIPAVQTIHDYRLLCPANAFLDRKNRICEKCKNKFFLQCSLKKCLDNNFFYSMVLSLEAYMRKYFLNPLDYIDHFIFVSEFSRQKHIEFEEEFRKKSSHLYNFSFIPDGEPNYRKGKYLLFFGRLSKEKGLITLLEAVRNTQFKLNVVGTGPLLDEVRHKYSDFEKINFLGYKEGEELENLIKNASFVVVPSEWYENNPMTIIEAFKYGRPVIASDIGGISEIVLEGKTGFLFRSRDKEALLNKLKIADNLDDEQYMKMSESVRSFSGEKFSPSSHYNRLIQIYEKILY